MLASVATVANAQAAPPVSPPYFVVGSGDFDGNGNADIALHNASTNETQVLFMDKSQITLRTTVLDETGKPILIGLPWRIADVGDLNADGRADIVWHNDTSNETQIWFMLNNQIMQRATVVDEIGRPIFIGVPWRIVGAGDLNADGRADIVWHNDSSNETQVWFMNGHRIVQRATVVDEAGFPIFIGVPWRIVGAGDLNADGRADIVWHNDSSNETQAWFMNAHRIAQRATVIA